MRALAALAAWVVLVAAPAAAAGEPSKEELAWKVLTDILERPASVVPARARVDVGDDWARPGPPNPRPIDAEGQRLIAAVDAYLAAVPGEHGQRVASARFLRANTRRRFNHLEAALPDWVAILEQERDQEVALYAANLLLDTFVRLERYDEMIVWVRKLRADPVFLKRDEDLAELLVRIEVQWHRKDAERHEQLARDRGDPGEYLACAAAHERALTVDPDSELADQVLYNAGVCLEAGGDGDGALARYRRLVADHPRSRVAPLAVLRSARLHIAARRLADAVLAYEQYLARWPGERDVKDVRREVRWLRVELFATSTLQVTGAQCLP